MPQVPPANASIRSAGPGVGPGGSLSHAGVGCVGKTRRAGIAAELEFEPGATFSRAEMKVINQKIVSNVKVPEGQSLCQTCCYAHIVQGYAESEQIVSCSSRRWSRPEVVRFAVRQCSDYVHRNHASLCQMEKIAWVLLTKKAGRTPGFVTPREFKDIEGEDAEVLP